MSDRLKIAISQLDFTSGDIEGNAEKILQTYNDVAGKGVDLVIFSELCVTGYPPEDLILRSRFRKKATSAVEDLAIATKDKKTAMLIGSVLEEGSKIYNAVFLLENGEITKKQCKHDLPNYGVFDEKRVFNSAKLPDLTDFRGVKLGIMICEDMWNMRFASIFADADILVSINASPFEVGKHKKRINVAKKMVQARCKPLIYINQICGQDDLVFDGDSFVMSCDGENIPVRLSRTEEAVEITNWSKNNGKWSCTEGTSMKYDCSEAVIYQAMMLGLKSYVLKNGFRGVIIGLSGGIDSALTAAIAVDALGADKVKLVMMPSRYTSNESIDDARKCAKYLGAALSNIPIEDIFTSSVNTLLPHFEGKDTDITEENMQSRIRGVILMALSNKFGDMVVTTGNKSEMSVGYATLYGDMCGGYSVLKDVYKTQVFALSEWRNKYLPEGSLCNAKKVMPENVITKPPTAELRDNQKDEDSLPPYDVLDRILEKLVEKGLSLTEVIEQENDEGLVKKIHKLLHLAEYKRRQSSLGVKISARPFGRDRRYPITNGFA